MATRKEVLANIAEAEKDRVYDRHVDPVDYSVALPVGKNYKYLKKGFFITLKETLLRIFIVRPFTRSINKRTFKTKVLGKENIKGVKRAVVTCNHINMFDCLVAKWALSGNKLHITAASFNNRSDKLGGYMRAGGMIPFGEGLAAMRNFNHAVETFLKDGYVLFYPEQALWWNYEKPRPFKNGAFMYAVKHNVPVIPTFITYNYTDRTDAEGLVVREYNYNIMPPIYPEEGKSINENIEMLREKCFKACVDKYEEFYGKKYELISADNYDCQ